MDLDSLTQVLASEPAYRLTQAKEAIFQQLISNWSQAKALPKALQEKLNQHCPLNIKVDIVQSGSLNTLKSLITLGDNLKVETVLMNHKDGRNTVCVSSMVGCPMGCVFCATGKLGFKRNLETSEILEQVLFFQRLLKKDNKRVTNVVFMGMGEPFLNWDNILKSLKFLNDPQMFNIGARHISISTVGIKDSINKLITLPLQINLAVSLHAPTNDLRSRLIPANNQYPIESLLRDVKTYVEKTKRKVMFEYIMIKDVNDSDQNARELTKLINHYLYMVNLIPYNPTAVFKPSTTERIKQFRLILETAGINVTQRFRFGRDINAACGQLTGRFLSS